MSIEKKQLQFNLFKMICIKCLLMLNRKQKEYITFYTTGLNIALRGFLKGNNKK